MAKMDFVIQENGCLMQSEGKTDFLMNQNSFGPTHLFTAGIGG